MAYKDTITAADGVSDNMKVFADYTIATKLPNYLDGLKAISRRILVTLHRMGPGLHKELSVGGEIVKMHPHGDASINTAISVMAQPFTHIAPLVFSDSNIGNYDGDDPAGARYVDVAESDIAKAIFFTDVNTSMFDMVPCESEQGTEPKYLIPRIPTALMVSSFAIGVGYQSRIPSIALPDLCKMTKEYIRIRAESVDWQRKVRKALIKYMIPDFPTDCVIRNSGQLLEQYKDGNFDAPVLVDGTMTVTKDQVNVFTLPPDTPFRDTMFNVGNTMAKVKNSWEAQNFQQIEGFAGDQQGIMRGNYKCVVRRGMNPFDVLATLKDKIKFTSYWRPVRHYTDYVGNLRKETPLTLLDNWYDVRYNAVLGDLKQTLSEMVSRQRQLLALIIIRDHDEEVFKIFKTSKNKEDTAPILAARFKLTKPQAKFVSGLTFGQITAAGKDELLAELTEIDRKMAELHKQFNRVPQIMIESIERFEKAFIEKISKQGDMEYDLHRRCPLPKYIGAAVYRGTGHILVENETEFDQVLKNFDPEDIEFKLFDSNLGKLSALGADENLEDGIDLPKYLKAVYVDRIPNVKYTGCQLDKGAMVVNGLIPPKDHMKFAIPLDNEFIVVEKNGTVHREKVTDKHIRKSLTAGATMKDAVHIANGGNDVIIVHGNSSQTNLLMIERVDLSSGSAKLKKIPVGEWKILGVFTPDTKRVYLNIPKELRQRCATRHVVIDNLGQVIAPNKKMYLAFGRTTIKTDFDLTPIRKKSSILLAKPI